MSLLALFTIYKLLAMTQSALDYFQKRINEHFEREYYNEGDARGKSVKRGVDPITKLHQGSFAQQVCKILEKV